MYQYCFEGKRRIFSLILIIVVLNINELAAAGTAKNKVTTPEIFWAIQHPFILSKARKITKRAIIVTDSLEQNEILRGRSGGKLDAFKHAFWMAMLVQNMKVEKALKLGVAHEKNSFKSFIKEKSTNDKVASEMDLWNNNIGKTIEERNPFLPEDELIDAIISAVKNGEMKIVKKNSVGNSLDSNGLLIDKSDLKTWENKRCLVYSDYQNN